MTLLTTHHSLLTFFKTRPWAGAVFVFSLSLLFSRWFWPSLTFADPDSFYHIYLAEQLPRGLVRDFPWLPFTSLVQTYTDHHFLYHVFIAPFVSIFGPFVGAWTATVILAGIAHAVFYATMRTLRFRAPLFFTLLLFSASAFEFRMHLAKAPAVSLIFVLLGICFLARKRLIALGILAFLFVWAHGSWPLLPILTFVWCAADFLVTTPSKSPPINRERNRAIFSPSPREGEIKRGWVLCAPFVATFVGSLFGLVMNPYFPQNIPFYWRIIVEIGVVNFGSAISVGEEWYPPGSGYLVRPHLILILVGIAVLAAFIVRARAVSAGRLPIDYDGLKKSGRAILLATIIAMITMKSRRHMDYFAPFLTLGIASLATLSWDSLIKMPRAAFLFLRAPSWSRRFVVVPCVLFMVSVATLTGFLLTEHRRALIDGYPPEQFAAVGLWLRDHAEHGSIIFHTEWDDFPFFMYYAPQFRYIAGLDPTFFYRHDRERYELWNTLIHGEYAGDVIELITQKFNARYIAITLPPRFELFERQVSLSHRAREVYRDSTVMLFEIL